MNIPTSSPEEMQSQIDDYFFVIKETQQHRYIRPSVDGLANHLGIERNQIMALKQQEAYAHPIGMALTLIECDLEKRLMYDFDNLDAVMNELCVDFGWEPLSESERQII